MNEESIASRLKLDGVGVLSPHQALHFRQRIGTAFTVRALQARIAMPRTVGIFSCNFSDARLTSRSQGT